MLVPVVLKPHSPLMLWMLYFFNCFRQKRPAGRAPPWTTPPPAVGWWELHRKHLSVFHLGAFWFNWNSTTFFCKCYLWLLFLDDFSFKLLNSTVSVGGHVLVLPVILILDTVRESWMFKVPQTITDMFQGQNTWHPSIYETFNKHHR